MESSILIVDDDRDVLDLADYFFRDAGFEVHCAENAWQALEKIRGNRFSMMITDYNMPGMDGLELAEKAREIAPGLRIVMVTGHPSQELSEQAAGAGIEVVIEKPLQLEGLLDLLQIE